MKIKCLRGWSKFLWLDRESEFYEGCKVDNQLSFLRSLIVCTCLVMAIFYILILAFRINNITILATTPILLCLNLFVLWLSRRDAFRSWISETLAFYSLVLTLGSLELCKYSPRAYSCRDAFLTGIVSSYSIGILFVCRVKWRYSVIIIALQCILASTHLNLAFSDAGQEFMIPLVMVTIFIFFSKSFYDAETFCQCQALKWDIGGRRLQEFKKLFEKDFPNQILIIGRNKHDEHSILFMNESAIDFFQTENKDKIFFELNNMEIFKNYHQKSSFNNNNTFQQTRIHELIGESKGCGEFSTYLASFSESALKKNTNNNICNSTRLELKVGKVHWDDYENATLLMISDISKSERIVYLQTLHEHKDKMLATVSHDLRTPINGIVGLVEMSMDLVESQKAKKQLKLAINSANSLLLMINDLLDVSQIAKGKLQLNYEECDINVLVDPILDLIRFPMKKKGLELIYDNKLDAGTLVKADKNRFQQILMNLLGNAVKFTKTGFIKLSIHQELFTLSARNKEKSIKLLKTVVPEKNKMYCSAEVLLHNESSSPLMSPALLAHSVVNAAVFCVEDSGIGIKKENLEGLFKEYGKFEKVENKTGVGLGLSISQKLAQRMAKRIHGGIRVKSEEGHGSQFWFPLEMCADSGSTLKIQEMVEVNSIKNFQKVILDKNFKAKPKPRLLLVDDDLINIMVLKSFVKSLDLDYEVALNGLEALSRIEGATKQNHFFDVVYMDLNMPLMNGFECTRKINQLISKGDIPNLKIIALTAGTLQDERNLCLMAGMHDVLSKPITRSDFSKKLEEYTGYTGKGY